MEMIHVRLYPCDEALRKSQALILSVIRVPGPLPERLIRFDRNRVARDSRVPLLHSIAQSDKTSI